LAGYGIQHRLYWTDNVSLSYATFSLDNCKGTFQNVSGMALTGDSDWSNFTYNINSTLGCTMRWRVYANDTSDNWNASEIFSYETTEVTAPTLVSTSVSSTYRGRSSIHYFTLSDNYGLSSYRFSFDNCVGVFTNDTAIAISGLSYSGSVTKTLNTTLDCTVRYCFYVNDTSNNWLTTCGDPESYKTTGVFSGFTAFLIVDLVGIVFVLAFCMFVMEKFNLKYDPSNPIGSILPIIGIIVTLIVVVYMMSYFASALMGLV